MLLTTPFIIAGAATIFTFQTWSIISPHEDTDSAIDALSDTSKVIKDKSAYGLLL